MKWIFAQAALSACLSFIAFSAGADSQALTLESALNRTQSHHPELASFVFQSRAAQAEMDSATMRPTPELDLTVEDAFGSGDHGGFDAAQSTLALSQLIELGDRRERRGEVAQARSAMLQSQQAARQLDIVAQVTRHFVLMNGQQRRLEAVSQSQRLANQLARTVEERVRAAAAPQAERARARVAVAEAELLAEDAEHVLKTYRAELAAAMGLPEPDFDTVQGEIFALPEAESFDAYAARLAESPDFLLFANETRLRDAQLNLARSQARGALRARLGLRRTEATGDTALVAGLSLPLFAGRQAAPRIEQAEAASGQVSLDRQAHWNAARAQLFAHYQEMQHARHVEHTLRTEILPALQTALGQTEDAYRRGRYSYLQLADIQNQLLDARLRRIAAAEDFHINRIEIERLTGAALGRAGEIQ